VFVNRHEAEAIQDEVVAGDITPDRTCLRRSSSIIPGFTTGCVLIVAVFLLWSCSDLGATRVDRIRSAVNQGNWTRVVSLSDDDASRRDPIRAKFRMRALFRLGKSRDAVTILSRLR